MARPPDFDERWNFDHLPPRARDNAVKAAKRAVASVEIRERGNELEPPRGSKPRIMTIAERRAGLRPGQ